MLNISAIFSNLSKKCIDETPPLNTLFIIFYKNSIQHFSLDSNKRKMFFSSVRISRCLKKKTRNKHAFSFRESRSSASGGHKFYHTFPILLVLFIELLEIFRGIAWKGWDVKNLVLDYSPYYWRRRKFVYNT